MLSTLIVYLLIFMLGHYSATCISLYYSNAFMMGRLGVLQSIYYAKQIKHTGQRSWDNIKSRFTSLWGESSANYTRIETFPDGKLPENLCPRQPLKKPSSTLVQ